MTLVKETYRLTNSFPKSEDYSLTSQVKRSAISIPSNIAEGWGRKLNKSYVNFLRISRGSLYELETQLLIAQELEYITDIEQTNQLITEIGKMLNGLIRSIEEKDKAVLV